MAENKTRTPETSIHFSDGTQPFTVTAEDGTVEVKGGWVVVTEGDRVRSYPARVISYVDARA